MSSPGPNPYAAPAEDGFFARPTPIASAPLGDALARIAVERLGKEGGTWILEVYADRITATEPDGDVRVVPRAELGQHLVVAPIGRDTLLTLRAEKITLKLMGDDAESFRRHLGADLDAWALKLSLHDTRNSLWWGLGLTAFWFLSGGLFLGVLAVAYLIAGIGRSIRAGRWLFLLAGMRAVALIAAILVDVFLLGADWWFGLFGLLFVLGANLSFRRYAFFGPVRD